MNWYKSLKRIRLINGWVPAILLIIIITDILAPYRGWRILIVGIGGALAISFLWVWSLSRNLRLTREMRFGWAQVGDRLVERFTLANEGWASAVWAEVDDQSTLPDYQVSRGTGVPARDSIRWHTEAVCLRRGLFTLGPTKLQTGDPFGIFSVTLDFPASMPLLVLPPIVPLPSIEVSPGGRSGSSRPRANTLDRTVSAASVREYASGDSKRWIHWKTTARLDELYVRMFDGTPAGDWWIILDMNSYVQVGTGDDATDEHAIVLTASLADRGLHMQRSVGLVAQGEDLVWLPPEEGDGQRWEILRSLALVNRGTRPLAEVLTRVSPSIGRSASLIIVTPSIDTSWIQSLIGFIRRGIVPTVLLLDPESFGSTGNIHIVNAVLDNLGVSHYPITKDVLNRPEKSPGRQGRWEWRVLGTGKAVPVQPQRDVPWRTLV
jgi:uncharacterized protein (DUF58 family)